MTQFVHHPAGFEFFSLNTKTNKKIYIFRNIYYSFERFFSPSISNEDGRSLKGIQFAINGVKTRLRVCIENKTWKRNKQKTLQSRHHNARNKHNQIS